MSNKGIQGREERTAEIVKVGGTAAAASVALALLEAFEGVVAGSVDMIIDGLSHITEAGTAVVTVVGAKLAGKPADKKHPFGYGRIEYLSALIIAMLTIYAGITGIIGGIEAMLNPKHPHYGVLPLAIVAISMVTRIVVGRHDIHVGEHQKSRALTLVGKTELRHSVLSAVTLISAALYLLFHIEVGSWVAVVISINILWNGIVMLKDTISTLLGESNEVELLTAIKKTIMEEPGVEGAYDLVLNNYGPDSHTGSVHISLTDTVTMNELDKITRHITRSVLDHHNVVLTGVGIYPVNTTDPEIIAMRERIEAIGSKHAYVENMHGFYVDKETKEIRLDAVVCFDTVNSRQVREELEAEISKEFPEFKCKVVVENDLG